MPFYVWQLKNMLSVLKNYNKLIFGVLVTFIALFTPKVGFSNQNEEMIKDYSNYLELPKTEVQSEASFFSSVFNQVQPNTNEDLLTIVLILLVLVLVAVSVILIYTRSIVNSTIRSKSAGGADSIEKSAFSKWWTKVSKNTNPIFVISTLSVVLFLFFCLDLYDRAQDLGTQVAYAPEQPIKFNHKLHAGQYGIQCQYCHTGVEKGKSANLPSLGTCMNCHNYINKGPQYGNTEIAKIYEYLDYDPTKPINERYGNNAKPVEWIRIHNLPDHVYFNHQQHVVAGKLDCANCHGAVNQMERLQQSSTLEMGWCINCHREKQVDTENPYYQGTFEFVKEHDKYTVATLGGLECSKCHY